MRIKRSGTDLNLELNDLCFSVCQTCSPLGVPDMGLLARLSGEQFQDVKAISGSEM